MTFSDKILFVIPARKGSKRLKGKNLKKFNRKPLIFWTIEQTIRLKSYGSTIITSNDDAILKKCSRYKNTIINKRPNYLSTDKASLIDVLRYLIKKYQFRGYLILLQPTSPLKKDEDIIQGIRLLKKGNKAVMSQNKIQYNSTKLGVSQSGNKFKKLNNIPYDVYAPNGVFFGAEYSWILKNNSFYNNTVTTYDIPMERAIDIDYDYQFRMAEALAKNKK